MNRATNSAAPLGASKTAGSGPTSLEIVRACGKRDGVAAALFEKIGENPILTAELSRLFNSAYFGVPDQLRTVADAAKSAGPDTVGNLVLCIAARDAIRSNPVPGFETHSFMDDSLRRAVAARCIGERNGVPAAVCFTIGLVLDLGLLAMFKSQPQHAAYWAELRSLSPDARRPREIELFGTSHDKIGAAQIQAWGGPAAIAGALLQHHESAPPAALEDGVMRLGEIARGADWLAAVYSSNRQPDIVNDCRRILGHGAGIAKWELEDLLAQIDSMLKPAAASLGMRLRERQPEADAMRDTHLRLKADNVSYKELAWRFNQTLEERDRLADELRRDLELAREIQQSLLPRGNDGHSAVRGINIPARQVSGDFYDYFTLDDGRVYFAVCDVSGKGMNAALLLAKISTLFRFLGKRISEPARLLATINTEICETVIRGMFVTMAAGLYDPASGLVRLVNAGNPPPLHLRTNGRVKQIDATEPPLGILPETTFTEVELLLEGGSLYLYTDGLTESRHNPVGTPDTGRIISTLASLKHLPAEQRLGRAVGLLHPADEAMKDDITLMVVEEANSR
jgi:phosphoserine phosphatase RsbU/P